MVKQGVGLSSLDQEPWVSCSDGSLGLGDIAKPSKPDRDIPGARKAPAPTCDDEGVERQAPGNCRFLEGTLRLEAQSACQRGTAKQFTVSGEQGLLHCVYRHFRVRHAPGCFAIGSTTALQHGLMLQVYATKAEQIRSTSTGPVRRSHPCAPWPSGSGTSAASCGLAGHR